LVKGGLVAIASGVRVFIPATQAVSSREEPVGAFVNQKVDIKIIEYNREKRRIIGSIRAVTRGQRKELSDKFWQEVEIGKVYTAPVKSVTSYGAFVDLGGVDGMAHISELSWSRLKHPSEAVNVGDVIEVYVKDIDREKGRVSLGYKKTEDDPWIILKNNFKIGDVIRVTVSSMTAFGAFARVIPGIDGLIHISQISDEHVAKPQDVLKIGEEIDVKLMDIDFEKKRVSLSIKALTEAEPSALTEEEPSDLTEAEPKEAAPAEDKPPVEEAVPAAEAVSTAENVPAETPVEKTPAEKTEEEPVAEAAAAAEDAQEAE